MFFSIENHRGAGSPRPRGGRGFCIGLSGKTQSHPGPPPGRTGPYSAPSASLRCVFDLSSEIPVTLETERRPKRIRRPLNFVSVRKKSALYFVGLTEILIEPLFRLERVPKRTNLEGRAQFARGDAGFRRRGRANSALPYNGDGTAERRRWQRGVN